MEPEKEKMAMLVIPESLHRQLKILAANSGQSIKDISIGVFEKFLSDYYQKPDKDNG